MTPRKLAAFRIALRNELWKCFPRADAATIWRACGQMERLMVVESFALVEMEHDDDCACWHCVVSLGASISRHQAEMRVAHQASNEHD